MKKYELTDEVMVWEGHTLYRIRALCNFGIVSVGDLGGFVEGERNLSQDDEAWVADDAKVYGNAKVSGDTFVAERAQVYGNARVYGEGAVSIIDDAQVFDDAVIYGPAYVSHNAKVYGNAIIRDAVSVQDSAEVFGQAQISGADTVVSNHAKVYGSAVVCGTCNAKIGDNAQVYGNAVLCEQSKIIIDGDARVHEQAVLIGKLHVSGTAEITEEFVELGLAMGTEEEAQTGLPKFLYQSALAQQVLEAPDEPARFGTTANTSGSDFVVE